MDNVKACIHCIIAYTSAYKFCLTDNRHSSKHPWILFLVQICAASRIYAFVHLTVDGNQAVIALMITRSPDEELTHAVACSCSVKQILSSKMQSCSECKCAFSRRRISALIPEYCRVMAVLLSLLPARQCIPTC